jgi:hypothetical protein
MNLRIENNLGDTPAVAQINEYDTAMVTAAQHPAHKSDNLANIFHCKVITGMTPLESPHGFHFINSLFFLESAQRPGNLHLPGECLFFVFC